MYMIYHRNVRMIMGIRILQEDVFNDKYDWCKELCEEIENLKKENKVVNRYLCKNGEYDKYI